MQSGIGFGLASFSGFGCVTRDTGVCEALSKRGRAYRSDTHSAPYFHKSPRLWGSPGAVLTRTPGTGRARIDERIQDSVGGAKAHCKAARRLGAVGASVEVAAALGTFSTALVSSVETA